MVLWWPKPPRDILLQGGEGEVGVNICPKKIRNCLSPNLGYYETVCPAQQENSVLAQQKISIGTAEICCNMGKKGLSGRIGTYSGPILDHIGTFYRYLQQNA